MTEIKEDDEEEKLGEIELSLRKMGVNKENIGSECDKQWSVLQAWHRIWVNGDAIIWDTVHG